MPSKVVHAYVIFIRVLLTETTFALQFFDDIRVELTN